jgi:hypothetical protein
LSKLPATNFFTQQPNAVLVNKEFKLGACYCMLATTHIYEKLAIGQKEE